MWENSETSSSSFSSFDLSFNLNDTNSSEDTNKLFSNDPISLSNNLSYIETMQSLFPSADPPGMFNDENMIFRKEVSTQSNCFLSNDEFDLLSTCLSKDNSNMKLNDFYVNPNTNNNNNNNSTTSTVKGSKRGRGRGSRGSYKPRGGNRTKLVNNQINNQNSSFLTFSSPLASNQFTPYNNINSNYINQSNLSNPSQKVCINPEILRRLGYSNVQNPTECVPNQYNPSQTFQNFNPSNGMIWNQNMNIDSFNQSNNQYFDQFSNFDTHIFNQTYFEPSQNIYPNDQANSSYPNIQQMDLSELSNVTDPSQCIESNFENILNELSQSNENLLNLE